MLHLIPVTRSADGPAVDFRALATELATLPQEEIRPLLTFLLTFGAGMSCAARGVHLCDQVRRLESELKFLQSIEVGRFTFTFATWEVPNDVTCGTVAGR